MKFILFCSLFLPSMILAAPTAKKLETATLAAGCFWGVEEYYRKVPGVMETQVGYAGGSMPRPTYAKVSRGNSGHAETVEIKFDPSQVTYAQLLDAFFKFHDPTTLNQQGNDHGTQYRSAIFYNSEEQKKTAEEFKAKVEKSGAWKAPIVTEIKKAGPFYPAEKEHQKYLVNNPGGYDNHHVRDISFDSGSEAPKKKP